MTHDHSALIAQLDALKSADAGAVFAELIRAGLQALVDAEATGGDRRRPLRAQRAARPRATGTGSDVHHASGDVTVRFPKLRWGRFFPRLWSLDVASMRVARGGDGGLRPRHLDPQGR